MGCPEQSRSGSGGPPMDMEKVPSMLIKDDHSWKSIEYTFSPHWEQQQQQQQQIKTDDEKQQEVIKKKNDLSSNFGALTIAGKDVYVHSCIKHSSTNTIKLKITYDNLSRNDNNLLPWVGLSFRTSKECTMFPKNGIDSTESILLLQDDDDNNKLTPYQYFITSQTMS